MSIFINNQIIRNMEISDKEFATYCAISLLAHQPDVPNYFICPDNVVQLLYGKIDGSKRIRDEISICLKCLVTKQIVKGEIISKRGIVVESSQFNIKSDFTKFEVCDIQKIAKAFTRNTWSALRYFCLLMATRLGNFKVYNKSHVVGRLPIAYFADMLNVDESTIMEYNKKLEVAKLIYVYHSSNYNISNIYGHYEDRELIDGYAEMNGVVESSGRKKSHSLGAKLARINNGTARNYTADELQEIWEYASSHNEYEQKMHEMSESYIMNLKDLTKLRELMDNVVAG